MLFLVVARSKSIPSLSWIWALRRYTGILFPAPFPRGQGRCLLPALFSSFCFFDCRAKTVCKAKVVGMNGNVSDLVSPPPRENLLEYSDKGRCHSLNTLPIVDIFLTTPAVLSIQRMKHTLKRASEQSGLVKIDRSERADSFATSPWGSYSSSSGRF